MQQTAPRSKKPKNRYEVEPPPDRPEQAKEVRPDLEAMDTEKGAQSRIDTEYAGAVSRLFNEKRKVADVTDAQDTEYFDHDAFLSMEQQSLEKLANPETAKSMRPKDVAMAVGDLAGELASKNPDRARNLTGDAATDAENAKGYSDAKKVFMMAGEKAFPNVTVDTQRFGVELERTSRILREESDASSIPDMDPGDLQRMYDDDPKGLAKKLDDILAKSGDLMRMRSRVNFDNKDPERQEEANAHLAAGAEMFYKLQRMRDDLQEKVYGRKDVTPAEAKQIDAARAAFAGTAADTVEDGDGTDSREALDRAEKKAAAGGGHGTSAELSPALESFKSVWKKEAGLSGRFDDLARKVETMTEMKLAADAQMAPEFARRVSILQAYGDLMPAERRALDEAAHREAERGKAEGGARTGSAPASAERMFAALMDALREHGR
ncbi:MAG: hypothetical protein RL272_1258 [Candidatus Parcubacteria bacterium]|jgi:hypothetical protein